MTHRSAGCGENAIATKSRRPSPRIFSLALPNAAAASTRPAPRLGLRAMADFSPVIETMEHRWMRAWVNRDVKALKAITASNFILLTGSKPPAILDRPSWLEAVAKRWD